MGFIVLKIDLAKAYDRLQWDFIKAVLNEVGIKGKLNSLIMSCISSVQFKVILNDETSNMFWPKSGIRQEYGQVPWCSLIHGRVTKDTYKEILEKAQSKLATWKSSTLSFARRCTLIKDVSSTIPIYAMQSSKLPIEICSKLDKLKWDFLWGHINENKKMHLVNWETVCLLKCKEGLGIKKTKMMNQVMLAKARWKLYHNENGLWGHLLKHKYLKGDDSVNHDDWVPDIGKLLSYATFPLSATQNSEIVSNYMAHDDWDIQMLSSVLPWHIIHRIVSIHAGRSQSGSDRAIWGLSKNGDFSVKSVYMSLFKNDEMPNWKWNFLWNLRIPPRGQNFLWILLHG
ncbi:hypothetical protein Dsin_030440 [Dipteronia sinensis]|uniref:Reverse transcriptase zinc-binding domain-containing protein n=1 Tax=Dipteronia sinensis TaxID=43782 RepID=A0AAE0DRB0_9ROSI|nr:hypothetical protein Dsin_030440 [Dipteronia sinensis]